MPLNINTSYNDTFKAFADFATQAKTGRTIAKVGGDQNAPGGVGSLAGRTIVAKSWDFIGNVGRRAASRDANNVARDLFRNAIADMFGGPDKIPDSVKDAMKLSDFGKGRPLTARRIIAVKTAVDRELAAKAAAVTIDKTVGGRGAGADAMKNVLRAKLDGVQNPAQKLSERLSANANAMMNWSLCAEMKKLAADGGETSQFKKDITRQTNATLCDGETTFKLSNDFEKSRDELAQFVTGDPKATYGSLAKSEDRNKVHLLMALISQETEKAGEDGSKLAMDTREADGAFQITGFSKFDREHGIGADTSRTFVVTKRADGGIDLNYTMDKPLKEVDDGTTDGFGYKVGDGSKFLCKLDYTLNGTEFNRLVKLDFGKFDGREAQKIYDKKIDMPDGTRQFQEHKLEKVVDSFADEFKVKADCKMDFTLQLNPTLEEEISQHKEGPIIP